MDKNSQKKFLLAVSGGVDSMVMLHMFLSSLPTQSFAVVSVNHNLRPEGAFDCNFVKQYCQENNVVFFAKNVNVTEHALQNKLSIETSARQLRYQAIEEVADTYGYDTICLAHHAEDNAETVLLHLARGGGLRGVSGIRRRQGRFFRPLLKLTKEEILQYAHSHNLPYVVDQTNADIIYKRNLVRHEVLPRLKEINPSVIQAINSFATLAQQEDDFLDGLADMTCVSFQQNNMTATIDLDKFNNLHTVLKARVLRKTMRALNYYKDVEQRHLVNVINLTKTTNGETQINLPFGLIARRTYNFLTICPQTQQEQKLLNLQLPFVVGEFEFDKFTIGVFTAPPDNLPYLMVDAGKIPKGAVIRTRKAGDRFAKFGSGEKKLKDYLIDAKVPQHVRDLIPIVAYDNTVYAVFGQEISQKAKITDTTKNVLYLAISNN